MGFPYRGIFRRFAFGNRTCTSAGADWRKDSGVFSPRLWHHCTRCADWCRHTAIKLYSVLAALALYGLNVTALSGSARRIALIISLLVFAVLHVFVGLIQFGLGENFILIPSLQRVAGMDRASGLYVNPNHLAGLLEVLGIFGLSITCWSRWPMW